MVKLTKKEVKAAKEVITDAKVQGSIVKKVKIKLYLTTIVIAIVVSLAVTFYSEWIPVVKDVVDKVVNIVTVDKAPDSE